MGFGCSYHPYECSHDKYCEHCTLARTDWHDPTKCALCDFYETGKPEKMVNETFAIKIRVQDYSHRFQKVKVNNVVQEVLL